MQLRAWELQDVDEEANAFFDRVVGCPSHGQHLGQGRGLQYNSCNDAYSQPIPLALPPLRLKDKFAIAPFAGPEGGFHKRDGEYVHDFPPPMKAPTSPARNGFLRPPIFGPERVVLDPRIKALHKQVLLSIFYVGFCVSVVSSCGGRDFI